MKIKGFVKTPEGYPVYKATVQIDGQNVVDTDEKGYYEYEVPSGLRTFKALKSARVSLYDKTAQEISEIKEINIDEYVDPIELVIDAKFKIELPDLTEPDKVVVPVEPGIIDKIKEFLGDLWNKIKDAFWNFVNQGIEWVKKAIAKLVEWVKKAAWDFWLFIKKLALDDPWLIYNIIMPAVENLAKTLTTVGEALGDVLAEISKWVSDLKAEISDAIAGLAQDIRDAVNNAYKTFSETVTSFGDWFVSQVKGIYKSFVVVMKNSGDVFVWVLKKIGKGLWNLTQLIGVQEWYRTYLGHYYNPWLSAWIDVWSDPWQYVYNAFWKDNPLVNQAKATISKILDVLPW